MDRRERLDDPQEALRAAMDGRQAAIWTLMPGIIESFDPVAMTCVVQPSIQGRLLAPDGSAKMINMPLLLDCPVEFPGGGGVTLTFPITKGDECTVKFASRCIDAWWQQGGVQPPAEFRIHDLSDGFAFVGVRSQPRVLTGVSTDSAQIRSDDGTIVLEVSAGGAVIVADAPSTETTGNLVAGTGASGSFSTPGGQTVTVRDGIITNIY